MATQSLAPPARSRLGAAVLLGLRFFAAAPLALALFTPFAAPAMAASGKITIDSQGRKRTAVVVERHRLKRALRPVVVIFRPANIAQGGSLRTRRLLDLEESLKGFNPIFVYPEPVEGKWDVAPGSASSDTTFVNDLVAKLAADTLVNPNRVVVIGRGIGAMMAYKYACAHSPPPLAAVALLGSMPAADAQACQPAGRVAVMSLAGTADPIAPFGPGKFNFPDFKQDGAGVDASLAPFRRANKCSAEKTSHGFDDRDRNDGSRAVLDIWKSCERPVESLRVEGGGHTLPRTSSTTEDRGQPVGAHNRDVDTSKLVVEFLKRAGL